MLMGLLLVNLAMTKIVVADVEELRNLLGGTKNGKRSLWGSDPNAAVKSAGAAEAKRRIAAGQTKPVMSECVATYQSNSTFSSFTNSLKIELFAVRNICKHFYP